jgi:flagellar operon protein
MSVIDQALLAGLSRVQPRTHPVGPKTAQLDGVGFDRSLESLLTPKAEASPTPSDLQTPAHPLQFSRHAQSRMTSRGLDMNEDQLSRLETAVTELSKRGAKESLVLMDDRAYVVGVPKRTVITMMSKDEAMGQVFTQIDSTYVAV